MNPSYSHDSAERPPLADMVFTISTFDAPATTSTRPTRREASWEKLQALLTRHVVRSDKDGPGWTPAEYKKGTTRSNANAEQWSLFAADGDHWSAAAVQALLVRLKNAGVAYIASSTYSHDPEADNWCLRVVLPLARPVSKEAWAATWQRINHGLFDGQCDPQTKDASRMFYLPTCPPGTTPFVQIGDGAALDPATLPEVPVTASASAPTPRPATPSADERERLAQALITASWPHTPTDGSPGVSRHGDYLMPLTGFLTDHLAADDVARLLEAAVEQTNDRAFLDRRQWRGEIRRLAAGSARRREARSDEQKIRGWPWLASNFGALATALAALYPQQTITDWPTASMPPAEPVAAPGSTAAAPGICGACPYTNAAAALATANATIARLRVEVEQERSAAAEVRGLYGEAHRELVELRRQEPQAATRRLVQHLARFESDPTTRGLALPTLVLLAEQQEAIAAGKSPNEPIPWRGEERSKQFGRDANTLRKAVDRLEERGVIAKDYVELGNRRDGDWRREVHLRVIAPVSATDLPDAVHTVYRKLRDTVPVPRPKQKTACEVCATAKCPTHQTAPVQKHVHIACTECGAAAAPDHLHAPQKPSDRMAPPVMFVMRPTSPPQSERKNSAPTYRETERKNSVPTARPSAPIDSDSLQAILDRVNSDPKWNTMSPAEAVEAKVAAYRAAMQGVA